MCQSTVITCLCAFSSFAICLFDFPVMLCALTGVFPQFVQVWIAQLPPWWNKALCRPNRISSSATSCTPSGVFLCQHHIIPVARSTCAVQKPWPLRHSCGNHCLTSIRENSEKACCLSGLLLLLFMFLLPRYPWRSHEQKACFRWTAVPLLLPAAHPDQGSPRNSPHAVEFCSV